MNTSDLRVLLVDDEPLVTIGLQSSLDWQEQDCRVIGTASSAAEALEILDQTNVDIVFTDINMPGMNGIELIRKITQQEKEVAVIVLSVLDDFHHVREALRLGAVDYLLKSSITEESLREALRQAKKQIAAVRYTNPAINLEQCILSCISGHPDQLKIAEQEEFARRIGHYRILRLRIDNLFQIIPKHSEASYAAFELATMNLLRRKFREDEQVVRLTDESFLILATVKIPEELILERMKLFSRLASDILNISFSCGISGIKESLHELPIADGEARQEISRSFFNGPGYIRIYKESRKAAEAGETHNQESLLSRALEQEIRTYASTWNIDGLIAIFDEQSSEIERDRRFSEETIRSALIRILELMAVYAPLSEKNRELEQDYVLRAIMRATDYATLINAFRTFLLEVKDIVHQRVLESGYDPVSRAVDIINRTYMQNLTLQSVAEEINISPGYLSRLFTGKKGISFTQYVNFVRIEKAKILLGSGAYRVGDAAAQVGFTDHGYFSKVFRRLCDTSPEEYIKNAVRENPEEKGTE